MERVSTGLAVIDDVLSLMTLKTVMKMQDEER